MAVPKASCGPHGWGKKEPAAIRRLSEPTLFTSLCAQEYMLLANFLVAQQVRTSFDDVVFEASRRFRFLSPYYIRWPARVLRTLIARNVMFLGYWNRTVRLWSKLRYFPEQLLLCFTSICRH